jgi:hypothetical protein
MLTTEPPEGQGVFPGAGAAWESVENEAMTPMVSEQPSKPRQKSKKSNKGGAESGALAAGTDSGGAALERLAKSWDILPLAVRAGIEAMVSFANLREPAPR